MKQQDSLGHRVQASLSEYGWIMVIIGAVAIALCGWLIGQYLYLQH